jgi:phosphohistidine phosphatase
MELFLIRHATAADGDDDDARALTRKGRERFDEVVALLDALGVRFDRVLHSPKLRAVQTAERLSALVDGPFEVTNHLVGAPSKALLAACVGDRVALVGHEPRLSALLAWLVTGDADGGAFELKKGAVACLAGEPTPGGMTLRWLLPPKVARAC